MTTLPQDSSTSSLADLLTTLRELIQHGQVRAAYGKNCCPDWPPT